MSLGLFTRPSILIEYIAGQDEERMKGAEKILFSSILFVRRGNPNGYQHNPLDCTKAGSPLKHDPIKNQKPVPTLSEISIDAIPFK